MSKKYDPVIDFTAFAKLRDEIQGGLGRGFDGSRDSASSRRLEEVGEEIGDALTRGFGELFGRVVQTASPQTETQSTAPSSQVDQGRSDRHSPRSSHGDSAAKSWQPVMDRYESADAYTLVFELAGVKPADVEMELAGNTLTLSGNIPEVIKPEETDSDSSTAFYTSFDTYERRTGAFNRTVELPADATTDDLTASASHGLLTVSIPKQQSLKPRKITIADAD